MLLVQGNRILVAVSGGSDSLALLCKIHDLAEPSNLFAATVNHGLRREAVEEAAFVENFCNKLNIPHTTLLWKPTRKTAEAARHGRYRLLVDHARSIAVDTIALGHTQDDQAETVLMRALRSKPDSGTIGLSGMNAVTTYEEIRLWRPLLDQTRDGLKEYLRQQGQTWVSDPSNRDEQSERVRMRKFLKRMDGPSKKSIARLAQLAQRDRLWLSQQTAHFIQENTTSITNDHVEIEFNNEVPRRLLREVFSILIMAAGGADYRPALSKFQDCVDAAVNGKSLVKSVGRTLVTVKPNRVRFEREKRHLHTKPLGTIIPFEKFRSLSDDPVHEVIKSLKSQSPFTIKGN